MDDLEGQNDDAIQGLSAKVKMLKEVCAVCLSSYLLNAHTLPFFFTRF